MPRIVVLTALALERAAVRKFLRDVDQVSHRQGTVYDVGKFASLEIIVAEIGAGNTSAAAEAERAISAFSPAALVFVGVAGGLKDVQLGDVVVATKVYGYESGKDARLFKPRPELMQSSYLLEQRARSLASRTEWLEALGGSRGHTPRVLIAPIAAGEKVVASSDSQTAKMLGNLYSDAVAVEMEGFGCLKAARMNSDLPAVVVRGVSDLLDEKTVSDSEGWQPRAAEHAAAFALVMLREAFANSIDQANQPPPPNP